MNKNEYKKWFIEKWQEKNGLIRQNEAALLLGISKQAVKQKIKNGHLEALEITYTDKGKETQVTFIGMIDILFKQINNNKSS